MTTIFRVRVEAVEGPRVTLDVDHVYGWDWNEFLLTSRTLALHFLWETLLDVVIWYDIDALGGLPATRREFEARAAASPLGRALAGRESTDEAWNRANVDRFVACVGVVSRRHHNPMWSDTDHEGWYDALGRKIGRSEVETAKATYLIRAADSRWLEHVAPGLVWDSTAYDHDRRAAPDPAWLTGDVLGLARRASGSGDSGVLPVLADALEEAGCDDGALLGHCRSPGPHVPGCWALDALLGAVNRTGDEV